MEEILSLHSSQSSKELSEVLRKCTTKQLVSMFGKSLKTLKDPSMLLSALLSGISCDTKVETERRLEIYLRAVDVVGVNVLPSSVISKIFSVLVLEIPTFPVATLTKLYEQLLDSAKSVKYQSGKWLELMPRILLNLSTQEGVPQLDGFLPGRKFNDKAIEELCRTCWPPKMVVNIAAILKEMTLTSDQVKFALTSFLKQMHELPFDSIPPLVFQLHLLCTEGHKQLFLKGLMKMFDEMERRLKSEEGQNDEEELFEEVTESSKLTELRQTQGTVLLHLLYCVKSDQDLGLEFVKWLKANCLWPNNIITLFSMSLAFSFASMLPFQKPIFEPLKMAIIQHYKEVVSRKTSFWSRKLVDSDYCIKEVIDSVIESVAGWDHVTQGLVDFGFYLLDSFGTDNTQGKRNKDVTTTSRQMACDLGSSIILTTFKMNRSVRDAIINGILNSIVPTELSTVKRYTKLLAVTIKQSPTDYQQSITRVSDLLNYTIWLPTAAATELLSAMQPLLTRNSILRDSVMLLLNKTIFDKDVNARKIAVNGSLVCLKNLRNIGHMSSQLGSQSNSLGSQYSADIHLPTTVESNENLCFELLSMLRRCLCQQAELRIQLYLGFPNVLKQNAFLIDTVLDVLLAQANIVIEAGATPPIRLNRCTQIQDSEVIYMEPLPYLLRCIQKCLAIAKSHYSVSEEKGGLDDTDNVWSHPLVALIEDFRSAMTKTELEEFDLDEAVDFSPQQSNSFFGKMILGVYESLMEYTFFDIGYTSAMTEIVMELYARHKRLSSVIKEKNTNPKKKKDPLPAEKALKPNSTISNTNGLTQDHLFSTDFLISLLQLLMEDEIPDHQEAAEDLRHHTDFITLFITVVEEKISKVQEMGYLENENDTNLDNPFHFCCFVGKSILHNLVKNSEDDASKSTNEVALDLKCLECLVSIFVTVTYRFPEKLSQFLSSLANRQSKKSQTENSEASLNDIVAKLQQLVTNILGDTSDGRHKNKQLGFLITIITHLVDHMEVTSAHLEELHNWAQNLCLVHTVDDPATAKNVFNLFFKISKQFSSHFKSLMAASEDVHRKMGDVDGDDESLGTVQYALITELNCSSVLLVVLQNVESFLNNIEWVISKMKAYYELKSKEENEIEEQMRSWEKSICSGIASVTTCEYHMILSVLPTGPCQESTIRLITHYYLVLQEFTKYYIMLCKMPGFQLPPRFVKLVVHINAKLTQQVYTFVGSFTEDGKMEEPKRNAKNNTELVKAVKGSRLLPSVIYNIEQYERFLIKLSKLSKVNLTSNLKRSTNRDFRIDTNLVRVKPNKTQQSQATVQQNSDDENTNDGPGNSQGNRTNGTTTTNSQQPPRKRLKLSEKRCIKAKKLVVKSSQ